MIYHVIITPEAETDLRTSYCYIRKQAPRAAGDWIRRARQCGKSLARRPARCPLAPENASFEKPIRELFFGTGNRRTYRPLRCARSIDRFTYWTCGTDPCSRCHQRISEGLCVHRSMSRRARAPAPHKPLQRYIPMLLRRILVPLCPQHFERVDQLFARVAG